MLETIVSTGYTAYWTQFICKKFVSDAMTFSLSVYCCMCCTGCLANDVNLCLIEVV